MTIGQLIHQRFRHSWMTFFTTSPPPDVAISCVVNTAHVHPSSPTLPEASPLPLTFYYVFWLRAPPVQCIFFYRLLALHAFVSLHVYMANNRYELHYHPVDAVTFTVAKSDEVDIDSLTGK